MGAQEKEFTKLIDIVLVGLTGESTHRQYDQAVRKFLKRAAQSDFFENHQRSLMRAGLRQIVNDRWSAARNAMKRNQSQMENKRIYAELKRRKEGARAAGISIREFDERESKTRTQQAAEAFEKYAETRASEILNTWICDGGRKLADCTGADLMRLSDRERNIADGHFKTSKFYFDLAQHCQKDQHARDINPHVVIRCFQENFGPRPEGKAAA